MAPQLLKDTPERAKRANGLTEALRGGVTAGLRCHSVSLALSSFLNSPDVRTICSAASTSVLLRAAAALIFLLLFYIK